MSSPERCLPLQRTTFATVDFARALIRAWKRMMGTYPTKASVGVLWAHYALETGVGVACWNNNIGNVKHVKGDGHDYVMLPGTWEIINGKRVTFSPPHPATWFRAFATLDDAMVEHLTFLRGKRYGPAWIFVEAGDPEGFARKLKERGYYTASADDYARGMLRHFAAWQKSPAYDDALEQIQRVAETPTEPELPHVDSDPPTTFVAVTDLTEALDAGERERRRSRGEG